MTWYRLPDGSMNCQLNDSIKFSIEKSINNFYLATLNIVKNYYEVYMIINWQEKDKRKRIKSLINYPSTTRLQVMVNRVEKSIELMRKPDTSPIVHINLGEENEYG